MDGMGHGDILRRHRERLGLTQEQLAEAAGGTFSANTIGNIERGRGRPYRHTLEALCDALGLQGEELLVARAQGTRAVGGSASSPLTGSVQGRYDRAEAAARGRLGDGEFESARALGRDVTRPKEAAYGRVVEE